MNNKYDPNHVATEEEYFKAMRLIPTYRVQIAEEEDYYQKIILKVKLGEQAVLITSYLYGLCIKDCEDFSEIVTYWINKKLTERASKTKTDDLEKFL